VDNKVDEFRARIPFQRNIRDCNILFYGIMVFSGYILSPSIQPVGFSVHRADGKNELWGKKKGGGELFHD
jgi:hypothetical protein